MAIIGINSVALFQRITQGVKLGCLLIVFLIAPRNLVVSAHLPAPTLNKIKRLPLGREPIIGSDWRGRGARVPRLLALFAYSECFCAAFEWRSNRRRLPSWGWRRPTQLLEADCSALRLAEA